MGAQAPHRLQVQLDPGAQLVLPPHLWALLSSGCLQPHAPVWQQGSCLQPRYPLLQMLVSHPHRSLGFPVVGSGIRGTTGHAWVNAQSWAHDTDTHPVG